MSLRNLVTVPRYPAVVEGKVNVNLEQAVQTQRRSRDIAVLFIFNLGAKWEWVVNATPRPLYSLERDPVPFVQQVGWTSGPVWMYAENVAPAGIRSADPSPRSKSIPI
jgi:hypothetical protein